MNAMRSMIQTTAAALLAGAALTGCESTQEASTDPTEPVQTTNRPALSAPPEASAQVSRSVLREQAIGLLEDAARGDDPLLRANALEGLAIAKGRLRPLIPAGLIDDNIGVRTIAAMLVGQERLRALTPQVEPLLYDESAFVRAAAVYALRVNGVDADPTPLSSMLLDDPSPRVRAHAAFVLGEMGERSALPLLRQAAVNTPPRAAPNELLSLEIQISEAMIKLGDERQLQPIRAALYPARPEELEATALAVQVIGEVADRSQIGQLIRLAGDDEQDRTMPAEVRLAAADALARMGRREGSFIADAYYDSTIPAVRSQAAHVYGSTRARDRLGVLEAMMGDESGLVRVAAAAAVLQVVGG